VNRIEWTAVDPTEVIEPADAVFPEACPTGFANHTWHLTIEEGQATFSPVEPCNGECHWWDGEHIGDMDLGIVRLENGTDCPGSGSYESGSHYVSHPNRCDCNHWLEVVPVTLGTWPTQYFMNGTEVTA
jgi:hypothetical protein